ncbi:MAG: hypothetical protein EOP45_10130 [Sphingobacteriaceae bacterium]|nr:MAG: hypothetical protein EOP45_10130 [Sphingobacteriaceae bacterium]
MTISLDLDDVQLQKLLSTSVLQSLTQEKKEQLLGQSLDHLLTAPDGRGYDNKPFKSPIQTAFVNAVEKTATELVDDYVTKDGIFQAHIKRTVKEATEKWLNNEEAQTNLKDRIATGISKAFENSLHDYMRW